VRDVVDGSGDVDDRLSLEYTQFEVVEEEELHGSLRARDGDMRESMIVVRRW
jgi:hypothetical protein